MIKQFDQSHLPHTFYEVTVLRVQDGSDMWAFSRMVIVFALTLSGYLP